MIEMKTPIKTVFKLPGNDSAMSFFLVTELFVYWVRYLLSEKSSDHCVEESYFVFSEISSANLIVGWNL